MSLQTTNHFVAGMLGVIAIAACLALWLLSPNFVLAQVSANKLRVHPLNPHYLQDASGNPVVLIGFGNGVKNAPSVLDQLKDKVNYLRTSLTVWSDWLPWSPSGSNDAIPGAPATTNGYGVGVPYAKNSQGLWDLDTWNESFWTNFRDYLNQTQSRNFIVGITIWDGHSWLPGGKFGDHTLWNASKNVQGIQWAYDSAALVKFPDPSRNSSDARERLVYYQHRFASRLLLETRPYPHVLFELDNETDKASESWFLYWAAYIKNRTGFVVATNWGIPDNTLPTTPLVDMKSYHDRSDSSITPTRLAFNKVIVADGDNSCSNLNAETARKIAWQSFVKGGHWNDFVCPETVYPDSTKISYYGKLLNFLKTRKVPFVEMSPNNSLISTGNVLAKPGLYYLAYVEKSVNLDLTAASGLLAYEWYDPKTGKAVVSGRIQGGAVRTFALPGAGDFVLWVRHYVPPAALGNVALR